MNSSIDDNPRSFLGIFDYYDVESFGKNEILQFYCIKITQPTFSLGKDEEFACATVNIQKREILLYDDLSDLWPKKTIDFELSLSANIFLRG